MEAAVAGALVAPVKLGLPGGTVVAGGLTDAAGDALDEDVEDAGASVAEAGAVVG